VTDRAEPAEVQTARHLIAAVVGEARAGAVLDALDTSQPGRLARLARILTADQLRALAGQPPPALDGAAAPAVTLTAEQAALVACALDDAETLQRCYGDPGRAREYRRAAAQLDREVP